MYKQLSAIVFVSILMAACVAPEQNFKESDANYQLANPSLTLTSEQLIINQERQKVLVSVLDGGVDYNHPRFARQIRPFGQDLKGVGLDLVGNDLFPSYQVIDPETGADMSTFELLDISQHGTHVSALATLGGYYTDKFGNPVNAGAEIGLLPIRVLPSTSSEPLDIFSMSAQELTLSLQFFKRIEEGLEFSAKQGALVANMSLGCDLREMKNPDNKKRLLEYLELEFLPKAKANWSQMLLVIAAGNEKQEINEAMTVIPATFGLANQLTVGALDNSSAISDFTNYGNFVDVYIDGRDIKSAVPCVEGKCVEKMSGTSMATPLVSNLAAKIKLVNPDLNVLQIKQVIIDSADIKTLVNPTSGNEETIRVVNFAKALKMAKSI